VLGGTTILLLDGITMVPNTTNTAVLLYCTVLAKK